MFNLVKSESKRFAPTSYYNILLVRLSFLITLHDPNSVSMDNIVIRCTLIRNVRMAQLGWSASASFKSPMDQGLVSMGGELSPNNTYDIILLLLVTICPYCTDDISNRTLKLDSPSLPCPNQKITARHH